ncbi:MAG: NAD-dependent epimerase/dehydratase family protein [Phreatobacter sp.]|uniref:NAD-dependent epimerase/dehydratase family protein n=1 Tax=Phreatobacter sp. TaxID=1966341 RepID=UPI001A5391D3|nr:NAD-dependent epimerase/dehydratase family protein [Phreatobacter sp.]MBL8571873.1 NAD-dependent epimerase/dehydratase family protein [Phreatobacter sp.]
MTVLVTGAAGFIGSHVSEALIARGERVVGFDVVNAYYDPKLKQARLDRLARHGEAFRLVKAPLEEDGAFARALAESGADRVVHLAAQAGVRHSIEHPGDYIRSNLIGHFNVVEACRRHGAIRHLVYASSSSVYGGNTKLPFSVDDKVDSPVSLYAATKAADELISHSYSHLYGLPQTGLRFFTVYGPWGRPDMSAYIFTRAVLEGRPIQVFNNGDMKRDFTYVDDIVAGIIAALDRPPAGAGARHRRYNLGNHRSEPLMRFIGEIERATNRKAVIEFLPMQPGDVKETYADIEASRRDLGFEPKTPIDEGIPRFVDWFRKYHGV